MKPVASLLLVVALCACSGQPADDAAASASTGADGAATAAPAAASDAARPAGPAGIAEGEADPAAPDGLRPPPAGPATGGGPARFDGYGDLRFGMGIDEARAAWGGRLEGRVDGNACTYLNPAGNRVPSYFAFMFEGGRFVRYDVGNDAEVAPGGGRRGMAANEIRRLYGGRVQESPHEYVEGGKYLKVVGEGGALVFETDAKGVVTEWHAGVEPQVDYIEGCS